MLKIGIIGMGTISKIHTYVLSQNSKGKLVAICDTDEEKLKGFEDVATYTDIDTMLENEILDVVHICLPHYLHVPVAIKCAKKGIHIFEEKPVAISVEQAKELFEIEEKYNIKIGICFQNRFNNTTIKMKELLAKEGCSKILGSKGIVTWHRNMEYYNQAPWRGNKAKSGGGAMINQSIHTLDLLSYLVGEFKDVESKVANFTLKQTEIEDSVIANLNYKDINANSIFFVTIGYCSNSGVQIEVVCEKFTFRIDDGILYKIDNETFEKEFIVEDEKLPGAKHYYGAAHGICMDKFYDAIINNTSEYVSVKDATYSLAVMEAIFLSGETNRKEEILWQK